MPVVKEPQIEPIPGYRLMEPLGSGGFGEVWKCEAPGGIFKAIKFVYGNLNALDQEAIRAEQELQALERVKNIRHPFILSIERVEQLEGELIIVMELADKDLHDVFVACRQKGQVGIERGELLQYLRDAAEALDLMNKQHNLQHLDIKPSNLFLVSNRVKVADFGLVKALEGRNLVSPTTGLMGGVTPVYAAPETFQGGLSQSSDQYSLAIVYQELLTGSLPFKGKNARQLMLQHTTQEPELESLPLTDRPIIARALAKKPEERWNSCKEMLRALIQSTPGVRKWESMEDIFLDVPSSPVFTSETVVETPPQARPGLAITTPPQLSEAGCLRPTLLIGLGRFGKEALQALRCRAVDRFGSTDKLPLWRFLYLDTDAKEVTSSTLGTPEQALSPTEVMHLPLHPVGHYRRSRQVFDQLMTWMPMEKFYDLPRSLEVAGIRAFGRLAFSDGYLRIVGRLKRELQILADPDLHARAVREVQLPLRSAVPQVYVFCAGGGGTGSGMLIDLAYSLRRLLAEQGAPTKDLAAFLFCGAPTDNATPQGERANLFATLTELNHYSDKAVEFQAEYAQHNIQLKDPGAPFSSVYLSRVSHRSPDAIRDVASRMASYVFHDLASPMGAYLEYSRGRQQQATDTVFRAFGSYAIWFPRGLLLRVAARLASQRLIQNWLHQRVDQAWIDLAGKACDELLADPSLQPATLKERIDQAATSPKDGSPTQALSAFLAQLDNQVDQALARDEPAFWCQDALKRLKEWVGGSSNPRGDSTDWQRSKINRLFGAAMQRVVEEYTECLSGPARRMFDYPGPRLAAADAAYRQLHAKLNAIVETQHGIVREQRAATERLYQQVMDAFETCLKPGSFFLFAGMRLNKLLKAFVEKIKEFTWQRLAEQQARAIEDFYRQLQTRLVDLQRDLTFCAQRLQHVEYTLLAAPTEAEAQLTRKAQEEDNERATYTSSKMLQEAATVLASRIVLPEGQTDLEKAAVRFLQRVQIKDWLELDYHLQQHVLTPHGGLYQLCMTNADLPRTLNAPLLEKAAEYLDRHLEVTDVCQAELSSAQALGVDIIAQTKAFHRLAAPSFASKKSSGEKDFLLVPSSPAGVELSQLALQAVPEMLVLQVASPTDLLICREQPGVSIGDIADVLASGKQEYLELFVSAITTPHSRCDVLAWVPLDP